MLVERSPTPAPHRFWEQSRRLPYSQSLRTLTKPGAMEVEASWRILAPKLRLSSPPAGFLVRE